MPHLASLPALNFHVYHLIPSIGDFTGYVSLLPDGGLTILQAKHLAKFTYTLFAMMDVKPDFIWCHFNDSILGSHIKLWSNLPDHPAIHSIWHLYPSVPSPIIGLRPFVIFSIFFIDGLKRTDTKVTKVSFMQQSPCRATPVSSWMGSFRHIFPNSTQRSCTQSNCMTQRSKPGGISRYSLHTIPYVDCAPTSQSFCCS
jgi:hypothetical protein